MSVHRKADVLLGIGRCAGCEDEQLVVQILRRETLARTLIVGSVYGETSRVKGTW